MIYYPTDGLGELKNHPNTSFRTTQVAQKWFEGFQAFYCTFDLDI